MSQKRWRQQAWPTNRVMLTQASQQQQEPLQLLIM
jgi:hypothetical protein